MSNIWFTADFHLGHANIIRYCDRPFADAASMDTEIIERLNSAVAKRDLLYFLGDFCRFGKEALDYRRRIRCKNIFFVEGNHDIGTRKIASEFRWWQQLAEAKVDRQVVVLCHYAMRVWHHSFRGSWHLYGHSHGRLPDDPAALSMDVGVDTHEYHRGTSTRSQPEWARRQTCYATPHVTRPSTTWHTQKWRPVPTTSDRHATNYRVRVEHSPAFRRSLRITIALAGYAALNASSESRWAPEPDGETTAQ